MLSDDDTREVVAFVESLRPGWHASAGVPYATFEVDAVALTEALTAWLDDWKQRIVESAAPAVEPHAPAAPTGESHAESA